MLNIKNIKINPSKKFKEIIKNNEGKNNFEKNIIETIKKIFL